MATVNFLYRSTRESAPLNIRLLFRHQDKDYVIGGKSKIVVDRDYWNNQHGKQRIKDVEVKNLQTETLSKIASLESFILKEFDKAPSLPVDKAWLNSTIELYYNPRKDEDLPSDLIGYINYYLEYREREISEANRKKVITLRNKILRLQADLKKKYQIADVNENFRQEFTRFCERESYSKNTQHRELVLIKTICKHARFLGVETSHQLDGLRLKREPTHSIYLTPEELKSIQEVDLPHDYLDNARDWLVISCYTGQRVSDFMRFTSDMIRRENGKSFLEFRQKKTGKQMAVPVLKEVIKVLEKRNGEFPRAISDQRYNDFIKEVCRLAGINEKVKGKRRISIAPEGRKPSKNDYRDVEGVFEKWELATSHLGRRSFSTNNYGKVPTAYLINITGHGSEAMFLNYIKKSNKDLAMSAFDYFE